MYPCGFAWLVLQALCQAGLGKGVLAQQLAKVHLDRVLQDDIVLIGDQDVMYETKCTSLQHQHELVVNICSVIIHAINELRRGRQAQF